MNTTLRYVPILRVRQEETKTLLTFNIGKQIYPCIEIIKELDRNPPKKKSQSKSKKAKSGKTKTFEEVYLAIIDRIKAEKVFVDLPVHMNQNKVQPEVLSFLRKVVSIRKHKTDYLIKLHKSLSNTIFPIKSTTIIPVISTYAELTGEANSIKLQENDLRPYFKIQAFRTFPKTFHNDILQIEAVCQEDDYLILDLDTYPADINDEDVAEIANRLKNFNNCHVVIVRSAMSDAITNIGLEHGEKVNTADNSLLEVYKELKGNSFGDYAGIKKDKVAKGFGKSPGFIFYNPLDNNFYGYRGTKNNLGKSNQNLKEFETIIVPDVINCTISKQIEASSLPFLSLNNKGWQILLNIKNQRESGQSAAKFKRISIEHYLHCIKTKINAGHFEV